MFGVREIKTELTKREVEELFSVDMEWGKHSIWKLFSFYSSSRIGLHMYKTRKGFKGYYENGGTDRHGDLLSAKTWFYITMKEVKGKTILRCKICVNPYCALVFGLLLFYALQSILTKDWEDLGVLFFLPVGFVFMNESFNDRDAIYTEINRRLAVNE